MKPYKAVMAVVAIVAIAGCSSTQIRTDYDQFATFRGLRTYAWIEEDASRGTNPSINNPLVDRRIRNAVDSELIRRGYQRVSSGNPDFRIRYHVIGTDKVEIQSGSSYGYYRYGYGNDVYSYEYTEGTLVIDIIDGKDNRLIWRGWARKALDDNPHPEQVDMYVRQAVQKLLKEFPPPV